MTLEKSPSCWLLLPLSPLQCAPWSAGNAWVEVKDGREQLYGISHKSP